MSRNISQIPLHSSNNSAEPTLSASSSTTSSPGTHNLKKNSPSQINYNLSEWASKMSQVSISKSDMNNLIMNYFIVEAYSDAVKKFSEESNQHVESRVLKDVSFREELRELILTGHIQDSISLLLEMNSALLFSLKQQHLIELIRNGMSKEAVIYAQKDLAPLVNEQNDLISSLEETMALLAYTGGKKKMKKTELSIPKELSHLLDQEHRVKLARNLNSLLLEEAGIVHPEPKISDLIRLMYWAQSLLDDTGAIYPHIDELLNLNNKSS